MSKSKPWRSLLVAVLASAYATGGVAANAPDAGARWQAYQAAMSRQGVNGIPATAHISDADTLGHHSIALYTVGRAGDQIWLVNTGADCEQPRLAGDQIVSDDVQGTAQACKVTAIHAVDRELLTLQLAKFKNGAHVPLDTGSAYGPNNIKDPYESGVRTLSMTDGGRTR